MKTTLENYTNIPGPLFYFLVGVIWCIALEVAILAIFFPTLAHAQGDYSRDKADARRADAYRGRLSDNKFGKDSTSNEFGRYGSKFSKRSINNEFGAGSRFAGDSPSNSFGRGIPIFQQGDE
jgi:hypothetical protein